MFKKDYLNRSYICIYNKVVVRIKGVDEDIGLNSKFENSEFKDYKEYY